LVWLWLGAVVVGPRGRGVGAGRLALGLLLIAVGVVTLAHGVGLIGFSFGDLLFRYWPLILIALGVFLLYQYNRGPAPGSASTVERIEHDSIFGDFKLTQPGWRLRDVRVSSVIGDMKIDLSKADIPDGETLIDLSAVVGDIDVWAPLDLPVALDARCTFVSLNHFGRKQDVRLQRYTDTPADFTSSARRVRIRVDLVFGDLTLTRVG
jgi:lia operon protein LiaF